MKYNMHTKMKMNVRKVEKSGLRVLLVGAFFICITLMLPGCFPEDEAVLAPPLIEPSVREYQTQTVEKGDIFNSVTVIGNVISAAEFSLSYESGGILDTVYVRNGTEVEEGELLVQLNNGDLEVQIELAELNLRKLELTLEESRANLRDARQSQNAQAIRGADYAVQRLELDLAAAELNLGQMTKRLESASLRSPVDGIVVYVDIALQKGDYIQPFDTIVQIADPSDLQVIFDPDRIDNPDVIQVGMIADMEIGSIQTTGRVVSSPSSAPADAEDTESDLFVLEFDTPVETMEMGDTINISIELERRENVVLIPLAALQSYMGRNYVFILDENGRAEVNVEVGVRSATEVEIISGLSEGQEIIIR